MPQNYPINLPNSAPKNPVSGYAPITTKPLETWKSNPRLVLSKPNNPVTLTPGEKGFPGSLTNAAIQSIPMTYGPSGNTHTVWQVTVSHQTQPNDQTYDFTNIWVGGYLGNPNPLKIASGTSPMTFLLEQTGEPITVLYQPVGKDGSTPPLSKALVTSLQL